MNLESDENYIPMTPIKPTLFEEKEKIELQRSEDANLHFNFPEHMSEKLAKELDLFSDNQWVYSLNFLWLLLIYFLYISRSGRPIRAYSIGNKIEHLKMNSRHGHINDTGQSSNRVRAYSVGSKLKMPRCDLQRVVLVEDKSTSAPLLSLKTQVNPDRMSDLMEIDFSQATNLEKQKIIKNIEVPKYIENSFANSVRSDSSSLTLNATSQKDIFNGAKINNTAASGSEDGYLEMKPVGNTNISSTISLPIKIEKLKVKDDVHKISSYNISPEKWKEHLPLPRSDEKTPYAAAVAVAAAPLP